MSPSIGSAVGDAARRAFIRTPRSFQGRVLDALGRSAPWSEGRPPVPPPAPAGMRVDAPDFVGIGVAKSGTTWWFSLLMGHPEIHVEFDKEIDFFNMAFERRLDAGQVTVADVEAYRRWFPRPEGTIAGEWTPHYAFNRTMPAVLQVAAPGAKVLVMLRDPVERYRSDLSRRMPARDRDRIRYRGLANGMYANILVPWERAYPAEDLLVLQYEQCVREPAEYLEKTFRFLGVDDTYRPPELRTRVNASKSKQDLDPFVVEQLVRLYEADVCNLLERYPEFDLSLWENFAYLAGPPPFPPSGG